MRGDPEVWLEEYRDMYGRTKYTGRCAGMNPLTDEELEAYRFAVERNHIESSLPRRIFANLDALKADLGEALELIEAIHRHPAVYHAHLTQALLRKHRRLS